MKYMYSRGGDAMKKSIHTRTKYILVGSDFS